MEIDVSDKYVIFGLEEYWDKEKKKSIIHCTFNFSY